MTGKNQVIADLQAEVAELRGFRDQLRDRCGQYQAVLAEHQPEVVRPLSGPHLELRCKRCRTDEHHTMANENRMLWPCPTVASFIRYAVNETQEGSREATNGPSE